jgi:TPR repeat protein
MSLLIDRATQKVSTKIADSIIGYLGPVDVSSQGTRKRSREEISTERDSLIHDFFLNFIDKRPSFLNYSTYISCDEFETRDLTRYLTGDQIWAINAGRISASKVNEFIVKLQTKGGIVDIAKDLEHYEDFPRYALIGHMKRGDVTAAQVASICLLYQGIKQFIKERVFIMSYEFPGTITTIQNYFLPIIDQPPYPELRTLSILENKDFIQKYFGLTDYGINRLLSYLEPSPDSEKYYHTIELPLGAFYSWSPGNQRVMDIMKFLYPVEVGPANQFISAKKHVMVIPSFSIFEACAKALYENNAIRYVPLLGECTKATISFFKHRDKRVLHVGMPQAVVPTEADNHYFGPYLYSVHDFYHGLRDGELTPEDRRAICHIVDRIFSRRINEKTEEINWDLDDGEHYFKNQNFGYLFDSARKITWDDAHKRALLTDMALLSDFWKAEFHITSDKLLPPEKEIYDSIFPTITEEQREKARIGLFNYYVTHARNDDPSAQYRLADMYNSGYGTEVSYPDAIRHWNLSGLDVASYRIGLCFRDGKGVKPSPQTAFKYFLKAAKTHADSQFIVGSEYYFGSEEGAVLQNFKKALIYFERAAKQGNLFALFNSGLMYRDGQGCEINLNKALGYLQQAAEAGYSKAQYVLGVWHYNGKEGVALQDIDKAFSYFNSAAKQGHSTAQYFLAVMHRDGKGCEKNLKTALGYFQQSADAGEVDAQIVLGIWYVCGKEGVVAKDYEKALVYFTQAALQKHSIAQFNLGILYRDGKGCEKNLKTALGYFQQSAEADDEDAQFELGAWYSTGNDVVEKDFTKALHYLSQSAEGGKKGAQYCLGQAYISGSLGVKIDLNKAFTYFQRDADAGHASAQLELGKFYYTGVDGATPQDFGQALKYFILAAQQGNQTARYNLSVMYRDGKGCEKNLKTALDYLQQAADAEYTAAQFALGMWHYHGKEDVVPQDFGQALNWCIKAAKQGHVLANFDLGVMYKNGQGCEKNLKSALDYFQQAADAGHLVAQNQLGTWYSLGAEDVIAIDLPKAMKYFEMAAKQGDADAQENLEIIRKEIQSREEG